MFTSIDTISLHSYTFFRHNYAPLYKWAIYTEVTYYTFIEIHVNDQIGIAYKKIQK